MVNANDEGLPCVPFGPVSGTYMEKIREAWATQTYTRNGYGKSQGNK